MKKKVTWAETGWPSRNRSWGHLTMPHGLVGGGGPRGPAGLRPRARATWRGGRLGRDWALRSGRGRGCGRCSSSSVRTKQRSERARDARHRKVRLRRAGPRRGSGAARIRALDGVPGRIRGEAGEDGGNCCLRTWRPWLLLLLLSGGKTAHMTRLQARCLTVGTSQRDGSRRAGRPVLGEGRPFLTRCVAEGGVNMGA